MGLPTGCVAMIDKGLFTVEPVKMSQTAPQPREGHL